MKKHISLFLAALTAGAIGSATLTAEAAGLTDAPQPAGGCFVDCYKTTREYKTPESNAAIRLLAGFLDLWQPRNVKRNAEVLDWNIAQVKAITEARTKEQEDRTYFEGSRSVPYSTLEGLGPFLPSYLRYSKAYTSIAGLPESMERIPYHDAGNGAGDKDAPLGPVVRLVNAANGKYTTVGAAKEYYSYRRPFLWDKSIRISPLLDPAVPKDDNENYGFPSGHTTRAYACSLALAYAQPARFREMVMRAGEISADRVVAGMHSCLDVMGGRMLGTAIAAAVLSDPKNAALKEKAYRAAQEYTSCQPDAEDRFADTEKCKEAYAHYLTYDFQPIDTADRPMTVPKGAEVLLETRFPYLDAGQRRMVLFTTGLPSGYPVIDDEEGWGRLDLVTAADGYRAFPEDVTVDMDAAKGLYSDYDCWGNDISGSGALTKKGSGELELSGDNSYQGGTRILGGTITASDDTALGSGNVQVDGGRLEEHVDGAFRVQGDYRQGADGTLVLTVRDASDVTQMSGKAAVAGKLIVALDEHWQPAGQTLIRYQKGSSGRFGEVELTGLPAGIDAKIVQQKDKVALQVKGKK